MMMMLKLLVLISLAAHQVLAFDYPRSLKEQTYVEDLVGDIPVGPKGAESAQAKLSAELEAQRQLAAGEQATDEQREEAGRRAELLASYVDVANLEESKCNFAAVSDLFMLIDFHSQHQGAAPLLQYLRQNGVEQLLLCRHNWNLRFAKDVSNMGANTRGKGMAMFEGMMRFYSYTAHYPYTWDLMKRALVEVPPLPLLGYMKATGSLTSGQVDEVLFDECYPTHTLREEYEESVLKLCRTFNKELSQDIELYEFIFSKFRPLDSRLEEPKFLETNGFGDLLNFYSMAMVCEKINRSSDRSKRTGGQDAILESVVHQLTHEPGLSNVFPAVKEWFASKFRGGKAKPQEQQQQQQQPILAMA